MSAQPVPSSQLSDISVDAAPEALPATEALPSTKVMPFAAPGCLPPPNTKRWVTRRKAEVVDAVRTGILTLEEACGRYKLSVEEFLSWQRLIERHGLAGLRATRVQDYRSARAPSPETPSDSLPGGSPGRPKSANMAARQNLPT